MIIKKTALIVGISGQKGSYMAKYLIEKKYIVDGIYMNENYKNLKTLDLLKKANLYKFSKFNELRLIKLLKKNFDKIYFFEEQSNLKESFIKNPGTIDGEINSLKVILDYIVSQKGIKSKFLYEGSSEIYGDANYKKKITKESSKKPKNYYGLSKLIAYEVIKSYRKMFNIPICTAIFFNDKLHLISAGCYKILSKKKMDDYIIALDKTVLLKKV